MRVGADYGSIVDVFFGASGPLLSMEVMRAPGDVDDSWVLRAPDGTDWHVQKFEAMRVHPPARPPEQGEE